MWSCACCSCFFFVPYLDSKRAARKWSLSFLLWMHWWSADLISGRGPKVNLHSIGKANERRMWTISAVSNKSPHKKHRKKVCIKSLWANLYMRVLCTQAVYSSIIKRTYVRKSIKRNKEKLIKKTKNQLAKKCDKKNTWTQINASNVIKFSHTKWLKRQ